jgi:WD40 repeat protein
MESGHVGADSFSIMHLKRLFLFSTLLLAASPPIARAAPTFQDDVLPVFKQHCNGCHNPDKLKADLDLTTHGATMKGGSSGECIKPGSPDGSLLYRVMAHLEGPEMPPKKPKLEEAQLNVIKEWISTGCKEAANSEAAKSRDAALGQAMKAPNPADVGPGAMPDNLPPLPSPITSRPDPIIALAASPRAPLLAVSGPERVLFIDTEKRTELGAIAFPERTPHSINFSRDGSLLLVAGGRGAHSGKAVVFDVKSGKRIVAVGDDASDSILTADISPDHELIACGSSDKLVRIYSTKSGKLLRTIKKHTDWVTSVSFSSDGTKLATGDRNGGLHLWDPRTGTILYTLAEHQGRIAGLSWRVGGNVLASAGDDGKLILWDTEEGWAAKSTAPHSKKDAKPRGSAYKVPGVLSVHFAGDGRLVTSGRDNTVRIFNASGTQLFSVE